MSTEKIYIIGLMIAVIYLMVVVKVRGDMIRTMTNALKGIANKKVKMTKEGNWITFNKIK